MKRKTIQLLLHVILTFVIFISCEEKVEEKKMTLVVASPDVKFEMTGVGYLTIDWGDGTKEQFTLSHNKTEYYHEYESGEKHTIILNGWVSALYAGKFNIDWNSVTNQIISLDAGNNNSLTYLDCSDNIITDLNISKCTELTELHCWNNQLTNLDVSKNKTLTMLKCWNNQLSNLDISKNEALKEMSCSNNLIINLDISHSLQLIELYCNNNLLTNLDASKNVKLKGLYCHNNQLTNFDASKNVELKGLYIQNNNFHTYALNALFITLHNNAISGGKSVCISGNPGTNYCDPKIAEHKGWVVF